MLYKKFSFKIIIRVILLFLALLALSFIFGRKELFFNQIILTIIILTQVIELVRFVNTTNRELSKFLLAIRYSDYSISFGKNRMIGSFKELDKSFHSIVETIKDAKIQKEAQYQFLKMMVEHISVGIISFKEDEIYLMNQPAQEILNSNGAKNWRDLESRNSEFLDEINRMGENGRKLIKINSNNQHRQLYVDVSSIMLIDQQYKLITFQDIQTEIEKKEIEAWNKLIRILTHEIMNSITPISSLTDTILMLLENKAGKQKEPAEITTDNVEDIRFSLKTIQRRSEGMLQFVEDYRRLTKVPTPEPEPVEVSPLLKNLHQLMHGELSKHSIELIIREENEQVSIEVDYKLLEQVLINLITNAMHAVEAVEKPRIELLSYASKNNQIIEIKDNGAGIDESKLESIFVPFYSTKQNGSGIGLSLSKQIMNLHGGSIQVSSEKGKGTSFYLLLPKPTD
ncbi:ATP-binding protein [Fulvivirgaceae bacterium BMA10]|uniref:histidine kinase n=1 Tax=Splendidivirga corallicola TaxID=3051826 RepID=A0ABT8KQK8_9BACT|nr:ATP-binding protein [Fulvivirgaceae bacterium BMA10]